MATTYHRDVDLVAGTAWTIHGTLYDAQGNLLDVTNCQLAWYLLDPDGNPVPTTPTITKTDPLSGAISIEVAKSDAALPVGRYTDALQVVSGPLKDVFWIGQLCVCANPHA